MIPPIARNFVAGETVASAFDHVEATNRQGVPVILNLLGEHYDDRTDANADTDAYVSLLRSIEASTLDACISVKPSQIGLGVSDDLFRENLTRLVESTDEFVWIDMEDHETTDVTLDAYERHARATGGDVGVCVQANLERTPEDLRRLAPLPGKVRLVKGAYDEPASVAHTTKAGVDEAYRECLDEAFRTFEDGVAVGSHDPAMIRHAIDCHETYGTPFEIQMLMGVREDAQVELAREYDVYQYVPYGSKWASYFYRRIRERKENALFALRAVLS